jgi:hypothetical protein
MGGLTKPGIQVTAMEKGQALAWQRTGLWPLASTPRTPPGSLHTPNNALHIQELLPHHSIGLQPDYYLKNGSKQPIWRLFRAANAVGSFLKTLKLCEFMYLAELMAKFVMYLTKNSGYLANCRRYCLFICHWYSVPWCVAISSPFIQLFSRLAGSVAGISASS